LLNSLNTSNIELIKYNVVCYCFCWL